MPAKYITDEDIRICYFSDAHSPQGEGWYWTEKINSDGWVGAFDDEETAEKDALNTQSPNETAIS